MVKEIHLYTRYNINDFVYFLYKNEESKENLIIRGQILQQCHIDVKTSENDEFTYEVVWNIIIGPHTCPWILPERTSILQIKESDLYMTYDECETSEIEKFSKEITKYKQYVKTN